MRYGDMSVLLCALSSELFVLRHFLAFRHAFAPSVTGVGPTLNTMEKQNTSISQLHLKLLQVQHLLFYIVNLNKNYVINMRKGLFSYSGIGFQGTNIED